MSVKLNSSRPWAGAAPPKLCLTIAAVVDVAKITVTQQVTPTLPCSALLFTFQSGAVSRIETSSPRRTSTSTSTRAYQRLHPRCVF
ncbi:hypothetical protein IAD21_03241 [Abditibacteriota bacterium]|nr:hypothetical protein IAD21_03241 [Abditibacteriota bacterium]